MPATVASCLAAINVQPDALTACSSLDDEFAIIKKAYFRRVLAAHPDKGGDAATFRKVQAAFEVLRGLYDSGRVGGSFATSLNTATASEYGSSMSGFSATDVPSWEFYAAAAEAPVPSYRVELARSNRSSCCQQGNAKHCLDPSIDQGEVRIGSMDSESGAYGRWMHLKCWRVPSKVWLGLPDPDKELDAAKFEAALVSMSAVIICGVETLPRAERRAVAHFCMNRNNWAKLTKRTNPEAVAALLAQGTGAVVAGPGAGAAGGAGAMMASASASSDALVARAAQRERFVVPVPGRPGIRGTAQTLAGKTFCMTGTFPELGGGAGLTLGKERAQALLESFGGRVTTCLSGLTDILLVGKEPGRVKYEEARTRCIRLMGLGELKQALEGGKVLPPSQAPELVITEFSQGYHGNGGGGGHRLTGGGGGGGGALDHKKAASSILAEIKARKAAREAAAGPAAAGGGSRGGSHGGGGGGHGHAAARGGGPPPSSSASRGAAPPPSAKPARPSTAGPAGAATPSPRPSAMVTPAPKQPPPKPSSGSSSSAAASAAAAKEGGGGGSKDAATFSFAPLSSIDITALKASRFLIEATRSLPYRDAKGLVSLHLLRKSAADVQSGTVAAPEEVASKLRKWLSHAEKAYARMGHGGGEGHKRKHDEAGADEAAATAEKMRRREAVSQ